MAEKETPTEDVKPVSNDNILAAVSTLPLVGLVMYFGMKDLKPLVKHYSRQSIGLLLLWVLHGVLWAVGIILSPILIGAVILCLNFIFSLVIVVLWIVLLINAFQGNTYKMPMVSDFVDNLIKE